MKPYRIVTFFAALVVMVVFAWAIGREDVGAQESQSIEAAAQ
jgi:hypothetical protein